MSIVESNIATLMQARRIDALDNAATNMPTLADVLSPLSLNDFMSQYLGQTYARIVGIPGRFHDLLTWRQLSESLRTLRVDNNRVVLVRQAKGLPRDTYVQTNKAATAQYLIGHALTKHVSSGATLVVNQVDELFPGIRRLAESCEEAFQVYVSANLYAGWRHDNGFDVHWDSHDTLIVQIQGRKDWTVWKPTRLHPLGGEDVDVAPRPTDPPVWEGKLEAGDVLYMPRGWWHIACPRDEPSLHITLGINHPTGLDLVEWGVKRMRESACARMSVPHWRDEAERIEWLRCLRNALVNVLTDDVLEEFMSAESARAHTRPIVRLPEDAQATTAPSLTATSLLRLTKGRRLRLREGARAGLSAFEVRGTRWQCDQRLAPALRLLNHVQPCTLADMQRLTPSDATELLRPLLLGLVLSEVIWIERSSPS
jgi:hypothetical protein